MSYFRQIRQNTQAIMVVANQGKKHSASSAKMKGLIMVST